MRKPNGVSLRSRVDEASLPADMNEYCEQHPGSPAAVRNPKLFVRGHTFVALLGSDLETGITGFGDTAFAALRAFDTHYLQALRPPTT